MNATELRDLVATLTVPANFSLEVLEAIWPGDDPAIRVTAIWPDIRDPKTTARTAGIVQALPGEPRASILDRLFGVLHNMWCHELYELFRVDGIPYLDPHPDGRFR